MQHTLSGEITKHSAQAPSTQAIFPLTSGSTQWPFCCCISRAHVLQRDHDGFFLSFLYFFFSLSSARRQQLNSAQTIGESRDTGETARTRGARHAVTQPSVSVCVCKQISCYVERGSEREREGEEGIYIENPWSINPRLSSLSFSSIVAVACFLSAHVASCCCVVL